MLLMPAYLHELVVPLTCLYRIECNVTSPMSVTDMHVFTYTAVCITRTVHPQIDLNPLEVAILGMQDKIKSLNHTLQQNPPDPKLLQMQLQGGIATAVNQASCVICCVLCIIWNIAICSVH